MSAAFGANASRRSERVGLKGLGRPTMMFGRSGTYRSRNTHTTASSNAPASMRKPA